MLTSGVYLIAIAVVAAVAGMAATPCYISRAVFLCYTRGVYHGLGIAPHYHGWAPGNGEPRIGV